MTRKMHPLKLATASLLAMMFVAPFVQADEPMKILGAPGAIGSLKKQQAMLEKASGRKLEFASQNPSAALPAFVKGLIDGLAIGGSAKEFFETDDVKKHNPGSVDDFEWLTFGNTTVMAVLHPDNPTKVLTHEQIKDLISGKLKTWESINGRKDPVKVVFNKSQVATVLLIPKFYLNLDAVPGAEYVTTLRGVAEKLRDNPGTIGFSGSKFEEAGIKPKFLDTEAKITYVLGAKKPLKPEMAKLFKALEPK